MDDLSKELDLLPELEEVLIAAGKEAIPKNLKVFIFSKDELQEYFTVRTDKLVVVTVARNMDTAIWNLKNFRHSYLAKAPVSIEQV